MREPLGQNYTHLLVFKILNGLCIGLLVPPLQSVIGDLHEARTRGTAFGSACLFKIRQSVGMLIAEC